MDRITVRTILNEIVHEGKITENKTGYNFRCVICHDSKKNKSKRRGWILFRGEQITYYCFNCLYDRSFKNFLRDKYPSLFEEHYKTTLNNLKLKKSHCEIVAKEIKSNEIKDLSNEIIPYSFQLLDKNIKDRELKKLQLNALKIILERSIPKLYYRDFLVCYEGKFKNRIIIPYYKDRILYAFQGRTIDNNPLKYLTYCEENEKIYRFYSSNKEEIVYITEGPIDSMFIENAIATSGTIGIDSTQFKIIKNKFMKRVWLFDNDSAGIERAKKFAENSENIFIWPSHYRNIKDINELVLFDNSIDIEKLLLENTYNGFEAIIKLKLL